MTTVSEKHGQWKRPFDVYSSKSYRWQCSVCGGIANYVCGHKRNKPVVTHCGLKYCPNCGAEMDGKENVKTMEISAKQAREMTAEAAGDAVKEEFESVCAKIYKAIDKGEYKVQYNGTMRNYTKERLKNLGYSVETINHYNDFGFIISWEDNNNDD